MLKLLKNMVLAVVAIVSGLCLTAGVAIAQTTNPLITAATTETAQTKTDLLTMGGLLFIVVLAVWGIYKLIGMFGRK